MTTPTKTTKTPPRAVSAQMRGVGDGGRIEATTNFLPKPTDSVAERPTSETDANSYPADVFCNAPPMRVCHADFARRLERERDEARAGELRAPQTQPPASLGAATGSAFPDGSPCPLCGKPVRLKLSGRGKHYGLLCESHGFVGIIRNPIWPRPQPPRGLLARLRDWLLGTPNDGHHSRPDAPAGGS